MALGMLCVHLINQGKHGHRARLFCPCVVAREDRGGEGWFQELYAAADFALFQPEVQSRVSEENMAEFETWMRGGSKELSTARLRLKASYLLFQYCFPLLPWLDSWMEAPAELLGGRVAAAAAPSGRQCRASRRQKHKRMRRH